MKAHQKAAMASGVLTLALAGLALAQEQGALPQAKQAAKDAEETRKKLAIADDIRELKKGREK